MFSSLQGCDFTIFFLDLDFRVTLKGEEGYISFVA